MSDKAGRCLSQAQMAEAADAAGDNLAQFFATATADDSPSKQPAQGADAEEAATPTVRRNDLFRSFALCIFALRTFAKDGDRKVENHADAEMPFAMTFAQAEESPSAAGPEAVETPPVLFPSAGAAMGAGALA